MFQPFAWRLLQIFSKQKGGEESLISDVAELVTGITSIVLHVLQKGKVRRRKIPKQQRDSQIKPSRPYPGSDTVTKGS